MAKLIYDRDQFKQVHNESGLERARVSWGYVDANRTKNRRLLEDAKLEKEARQKDDWFSEPALGPKPSSERKWETQMNQTKPRDSKERTYSKSQTNQFLARQDKRVAKFRINGNVKADVENA
jgi:hypothetical protein